MGLLRIISSGSFKAMDKTFKAQKSGHVVAVDDAIKELQEYRKWCCAQDKELRYHGHAPDDNFKRADEEGLLGPREETP